MEYIKFKTSYDAYMVRSGDVLFGELLKDRQGSRVVEAGDWIVTNKITLVQEVYTDDEFYRTFIGV